MAQTYAISTLSRHHLEVVASPKVFRFSQHQRVVIPGSHGYRVILFDKIAYCRAESNYTFIHLVTGERIMVSKTLKWVESRLNQIFIRVHQSWLVNLLEISEYCTRKNEVTLNSNTILPVSRSGQRALIEVFKGR